MNSPSRLPRFVIPTLVALLALGGWEWYVRSGRVSEVLVPAPTHIVRWFAESLLSGELLAATWVTMRRLIIGFAIGAALGGTCVLINRHGACASTAREHFNTELQCCVGGYVVVSNRTQGFGRWRKHCGIYGCRRISVSRKCAKVAWPCQGESIIIYVGGGGSCQTRWNARFGLSKFN